MFERGSRWDFMRWLVTSIALAAVLSVSSGSLHAQEPADLTEDDDADCFVCEVAPLELTIPLWIPLVFGSAESEEQGEEPIIGTWVAIDFRTGWILGARLDIGGFGAGSTFALFATIRGEYRFTDWFSMWAGWVVYNAYYRFEEGSLTGDVNLLLHGPSLGFSFFPF